MGRESARHGLPVICLLILPLPLNCRTVPEKFKPPAPAPVRIPSLRSVICAAALSPGLDFFLKARCVPTRYGGSTPQTAGKEGHQK